MALDMLTGLVRDFRASRRAASEIDRLTHMNSAQLARLGLERSDIASHVFRKHFGRR